jgi:hypothetical protein
LPVPADMSESKHPDPDGPEPSETLLSAEPELAEPEASPTAPPRPPLPPPSLISRLSESRKAPVLRLLAYYALLVTVMTALVWWVPLARDAFLAPTLLPQLRDTGLLASGHGSATTVSLMDALTRVLTALLVIGGALALVVPVAWVYMFTKRFRFDPALVASVVILPIVVAGIALVVRNSLARAFSLAGIVAAVRFRNTLNDPRDAVYIFLVIGIGLSAGVQALDVALATSLAFNLVVLFVWKFNVGSRYGGRFGRTGVPSVGDNDLFLAQWPRDQRALRRRMLEEAQHVKSDGVLLVHSSQPELARSTVQEALADLAKDWTLVNVRHLAERPAVLEYLVRLKRSSTPLELVGALDERWSAQVSAAEWVPFRTRRRKRK